MFFYRTTEKKIEFSARASGSNVDIQMSGESDGIKLSTSVLKGADTGLLGICLQHFLK